MLHAVNADLTDLPPNPFTAKYETPSPATAEHGSRPGGMAAV